MDGAAQPVAPADAPRPRAAAAAPSWRLLLGGDVMIGRGIDQVLPEPVAPQLFEPWVRDARDYVRLAEEANGAIARPVPLDYPWGDALTEIARLDPDARIVNLETAVTARGAPWPGKGIHYRASPAHVGCLRAAGIDACVLANNHVLDWGAQGLRDTLDALAGGGIACAGAGMDAAQAEAPAVLPLPGDRRLLLFAWAAPGCGVTVGWAAREQRPGVAWLPRLDDAAAQVVARRVRDHRRDNDRVVVSLHWGGNWVDAVPAEHRRFARRLIDLGATDAVFGHSSHHPLPIEVYAGKPVLYGCGDLINDYEGIERRRDDRRSDRVCLYAATFSQADGTLRALELVPLQLIRFRLTRPDATVRRQFHAELDSACRAFGTRIEVTDDGRWQLAWDAQRPAADSR